jgi:hypothetical protein
MFNAKRFWLALLFGFVSGFVCWWLIASGGETLHWAIILSTIISRALIGFVIGVSVLRIKWWLHGILTGAVLSIPMGLGGFMVPGKEMFILFGSIVMGIIYGFLIELLVTVVFKAKLKS